ncbi:MAG: ribosome hibernation-promoting factor, HPF/YfiA family [Gemmatimonadales bacterium]
MQTTITARHKDIPDDLKTRARAVVARLAKRANRPTSAHVTFDRSRLEARAEIVLNAARNAVFVASAEAADHRTALDRVAAKLERQLTKRARPARRAARKAVSR